MHAPRDEQTRGGRNVDRFQSSLHEWWNCINYDIMISMSVVKSLLFTNLNEILIEFSETQDRSKAAAHDERKGNWGVKRDRRSSAGRQGAEESVKARETRSPRLKLSANEIQAAWRWALIVVPGCSAGMIARMKRRKWGARVETSVASLLPWWVFGGERALNLFS